MTTENDNSKHGLSNFLDGLSKKTRAFEEKTQEKSRVAKRSWDNFADEAGYYIDRKNEEIHYFADEVKLDEKVGKVTGTLAGAFNKIKEKTEQAVTKIQDKVELITDKEVKDDGSFHIDLENPDELERMDEAIHNIFTKIMEGKLDLSDVQDELSDENAHYIGHFPSNHQPDEDDSSDENDWDENNHGSGWKPYQYNSEDDYEDLEINHDDQDLSSCCDVESDCDNSRNCEQSDIENETGEEVLAVFSFDGKSRNDSLRKLIEQAQALMDESPDEDDEDEPTEYLHSKGFLNDIADSLAKNEETNQSISNDLQDDYENFRASRKHKADSEDEISLNRSDLLKAADALLADAPSNSEVSSNSFSSLEDYISSIKEPITQEEAEIANEIVRELDVDKFLAGYGIGVKKSDGFEEDGSSLKTADEILLALQERISHNYAPVAVLSGKSKGKFDQVVKLARSENLHVITVSTDNSSSSDGVSAYQKSKDSLKAFLNSYRNYKVGEKRQSLVAVDARNGSKRALKILLGDLVKTARSENILILIAVKDDENITLDLKGLALSADF